MKERREGGTKNKGKNKQNEFPTCSLGGSYCSEETEVLCPLPLPYYTFTFLGSYTLSEAPQL